MTQPIDVTKMIADLTKRVEALENKMGSRTHNQLARLNREERRELLGLSPLHAGVPDKRDEKKVDPDAR